MRKKIVIAAFVVLALVFGVSAYNIIKIFWENRQVDKTYNALQSQYVTVLPTQAPSQGEEIPGPVESEVPQMAVDFEALREINADVVGWLYSEGTDIHYPVVQGKDNSEYLYRDLKGNYLVSGTLFVDFRNRPIGQDKNYIIYGHNMKSGRMFASLLKYRDQAYYESHKTMLYLTPEGDYLVEAVAGRIVNEQEILYAPNPDPEAYERFLQNTLRNSTFDSGISLTEADKLMIFSTCTSGSVTTRYVLICKYTPIEK